MRIVVASSIVRLPLPGMTWHHMQYGMGLRRLGHDVYFLEDSHDYAWSCYDPDRGVSDQDPRFGLRYAAAAFEGVGLGDRWAYHDAHTSTWFGPCGGRAVRLCEEADLLLNLGHGNPLRPWLAGIPVRILIDTDPVFTQIRHLTDPVSRERAARHTAFFSFGENVGMADCSIPDDGFPWRPTRQPVMLDAWAVEPPSPAARFTTVMQWESYTVREHGGQRFGMKSESFEPYVDLPLRAGRRFEIALGSATAPRDRLRRNGWYLCNPLEVARDPWSYQAYLRGSKGEFSVAKHGYVAARSGWFSERTAVYLASGRPALVQDTGFSAWCPVGSGLIAFGSPEEAIAGVGELDRRLRFHCQAARELAEEYFDARKVLSRLLEDAERSAEPSGAARTTPSVMGVGTSGSPMIDPRPGSAQSPRER